jgi:hypothetical protein
LLDLVVKSDRLDLEDLDLEDLSIEASVDVGSLQDRKAHSVVNREVRREDMDDSE